MQFIFVGFEEEDRPADALLAFKEFCVERFGRLFETRRGMHSPVVQKTFLFHALAQNDSDKAKQIWEDYDRERGDIAYVDALARLGGLAGEDVGVGIETEAPEVEVFNESVEEQIASAKHVYDFDRAWDLSLTLDEQVLKVGYLLEFAREIDTLEAYRTTREAFEALDDATQAILRGQGHFRRWLSNLQVNLILSAQMHCTRSRCRERLDGMV